MSQQPSSSSSSALDWQSLPTSPGVYIFKNSKGIILYIGKAKNLRVRVKSYFQPPTRLGPKTAKLVENIASLEHIEVSSEIEALLLESKLIKKFQPHYNIASKDDKSPYYIHLTSEKYPKPILNHIENHATAGPFLNAYIPKKILKQFRKIVPFCTANRRSNRPCLYSHLGLCNPCPCDPKLDQEKLKQYSKNIKKLKELLDGKFLKVKSQIKSQMQQLSSSQNYESAAVLRDQLSHLQHLLDTPISPDEYIVNPNLVQDVRNESLESLLLVLQKSGINATKLDRIELYDVANIQGKSATSAMTVAQYGEIKSSNFRHFTIRTLSEPNDVGMLREVLTRRLKRTDWPTPDLIILDGGKSQLSIIKDLIFPSAPIPIISIAKQFETLVIPGSSGFFEVNLPANHPGLRLVQKLRDEAHRFSRKLHHKHSAQKMLN